ncbi:MAG: NAD(P)/FAD-dependent oxidoreductase [Proteobacteria bacterium]|nr:NAD(P)/FAD-dependent oxidoreductase [Pseudomonadota bacterium]
MSRTTPSRRPLDTIVVGAGFAGLYMLHRLRGLGLEAQVLEAGTDIGGTWFWNRYPGARCDIESLEYSYSFDDALQQEWRWTERYASQPEILKYIHHVAERYDLRRSIRLSTRVVSAHYDAAANLWSVTTEHGDTLRARFCIMATGCLSNAKLPEIAGLADFEGQRYHTGLWPTAPVDFSGMRVGVIGTGSSGIQVIPVVAEQARELVVFQRTPGYSLPSRNEPLDPEDERATKQRYAQMRKQARESVAGVAGYPVPTQSAFAVDPAERDAIYETHWNAGRTSIGRVFDDLLVDAKANDTAADFVRAKIRAQVHDPRTAAALMPRDPIGTKRVCLDSGYYQAYNRPNVRLVDLRATPIEHVTPRGIRLRDGEEVALDALIFATGYDAMTGALNAIDIRGTEGIALKDEWAAGPRTLLGLMSAGFPNLFFITGPGSPSVLSNVIVCIEQHVDWIADCLAWMRERGNVRIEATRDAQDAWVAHVNEVAAATLFPVANSWYMGANVPGKARVFMPYVGGVGPYRKKCDAVAAAGYEGFAMASS